MPTGELAWTADTGDGVCFRFYGELNELISPRKRGVLSWFALRSPTCVKDAIESLGVPHTEVALILVNGEAVGWGERLAPGDRVSVYPLFTSLDVSSLGRLRDDPPAGRFVLDGHLGRLAGLLRMLGLDALYRRDYADAEIAQISHDEGRIVLTRDRGLLKRAMVVHGYLVRSDAPHTQVREVLQRFGLDGALAPLTRCLRCNEVLRPVDKADVARRLLPRTKRYYEEFWACPRCGRVYWEGSHAAHMRRTVRALMARRE